MGLSSGDLIGGLIEVFIADVLVVIGLTGQKLAMMHYDRKLLQSQVRENIELSVGNGNNNNGNSNNNNNPSTSSSNTNTAPLLLRSESSESRLSLYQVQNDHSKVFKDWRFILPFLVWVLGEALEIVSLGFASETVVIALGNLTLLWNVIASVVVFKEEFSIYPKYRTFPRIFVHWDLFSLSLLMFGSIMTVSNAPTSDSDEEYTATKLMHMWIEAPFLYMGIFLLLGIVTMMIWLRKNWYRDDIGTLNALALGAVCAMLSAFTVTLSKVTTQLLGKTFTGDNQYNTVQAWAMTIVWIFFLLLSLYLITSGIRRFEQSLFVPIYEVLSTTISIIGGVVYYKSYENIETYTSLIGFLFGIVFLCIGLYLTSLREYRSHLQTIAELEDENSVASELGSVLLSSNQEDSEDGINSNDVILA